MATEARWEPTRWDGCKTGKTKHDWRVYPITDSQDLNLETIQGCRTTAVHQSLTLETMGQHHPSLPKTVKGDGSKNYATGQKEKSQPASQTGNTG